MAWTVESVRHRGLLTTFKIAASTMEDAFLDRRFGTETSHVVNSDQFYKYGASDARFHSLGAMPFLFWSAIRDAKAAGIRQLDLGRSDSDNAGLITFKDRLGADRSTLTYVRYPAPPDVNAGPSPHVQMAKRVLDRLPDRLLAATGRLLYRHVG